MLAKRPDEISEDIADLLSDIDDFLRAMVNDIKSKCKYNEA